ncbi:MAG: glycosyltransferase family 2 protein [Candidatus Atribacteria bacterium]|nr:glycosyltransferase family 2 protein [Candidatus Atribacteria bacterium]MCD6349959.1 glycosyltransferase family 2 protein [Candidatus Atribacteria bacterium]
MKGESEKITIVIPAYNESRTIGRLIKQLLKNGYSEVVVVDDGSQDETFRQAQKAGAEVLRLPINRGTGGALRTGFEFVLKEKKAEIVVMMDADLQHKVEDIEKLIEPIRKKEAEVVIGSRLLKQASRMPFFRRVANWLGNLVTFLLTGLRVSDSQSGFRAIKREALEKMKLKSNRFEICSEMISEIARLKLSWREVPISTVYTSYSLSKGQNWRNGFKTLARLLAIKFQR